MNVRIGEELGFRLLLSFFHSTVSNIDTCFILSLLVAYISRYTRVAVCKKCRVLVETRCDCRLSWILRSTIAGST